jgi:hypothetical protein
MFLYKYVIVWNSMPYTFIDWYNVLVEYVVSILKVIYIENYIRYSPEEYNLILPSEPQIQKIIPAFLSEIYSFVSCVTLFVICPIIWLVFYNYCKLAVATFLITLSGLN